MRAPYSKLKDTVALLQELLLYLDRTVFDEYVQWAQNEIARRQSKNAKKEEPNE